jgi:hypothetical protein
MRIEAQNEIEKLRLERMSGTGTYLNNGQTERALPSLSSTTEVCRKLANLEIVFRSTLRH